MRVSYVVICVLLLLISKSICAESSFDFRGYMGYEYRSFLHEPVLDTQQSSHVTLSLQPEFYYEWQQEQYSLLFTPFARFGGHDKERKHEDIRSLYFQSVHDTWEVRVGIDQVFWGVTESQHLVDIINQTDLVEDPEGEIKLGQPMINLTAPRAWGTIDIFIMPYFRERTFPGEKGRLRTIPRVNTDKAQFESSDEENHIDYALRWSHSMDIWDVGLSYFKGTGRDPILQLDTTEEEAFLIPFYYQLTQLGLDLQATIEAWLLKLESVYRSEKRQDYTASTVGFEYTFYGIMQTDHDIGVLLEYLYDSRDDEADTPFENDVMLGMRWLANDVEGTEALIGLIIDTETDSKLFSLEASRRMTDHWKLNLIGRFYKDVNKDSLLSSFEQEDYWQISMRYYF